MKEKVVSLHCQYGNFPINEDKYNLNAHLVLHAWYAKANRDKYVWFNDNSCNKFGKFRNLDLTRKKS
jgi:hypothetical protein